MIKKLTLLLLLMLAICIALYGAFFLLPDSLPKEPAQTAPVVITIWGWDATIQEAFSEYQKSHPEVSLSYTYVSPTQYADKLKNAIVTGQPLPDICILDSTYRRDFVDMDLFENLEEAPYSLNREDLLAFSLEDVQNRVGEVVAIPCDISAAGIAFRKSLAREVLGTDDPDQISFIFQSWAAMLSKGTEIKQNTDRPFYLFASVEDAGVILLNQQQEAFVDQQGRMIAPRRFFDIFQIIVSLRNKSLIGSTTQWSPGWYASFSSADYLFYPCAVWLPRRGVFGGEQDWSLTVPPKGAFQWGGSAWAIPRQSAQKEEAWRFVETFLLTLAGARYNLHCEDGIYISYKPAYSRMDYRDLYQSCFGAQNVGRVYFDKLVPSAFSRPSSRWDSAIFDAYAYTLGAIMQDEALTAEEAYGCFLETVRATAPEITL